MLACNGDEMDIFKLLDNWFYSATLLFHAVRGWRSLAREDEQGESVNR
jgi:hypothetical protein